MPNPRELSQFGSFVQVNDTNKNIGIATTGTPFVGIGTISPEEKLHVVGNLRVDGNTNLDRLAVGVLTVTTLDNPNLTVDNLTVNNSTNLNTVVISGISTISGVKLHAGIITAASGIVTYYGDAQYLDNVGIAVTFIDNDVTIGGTITVNELVLTGGGGVGGGAGIAASTLNISGIATLGGVQITSGIVTAGAGTTTAVYYGDGYNLTNIQASALTGFQVVIYRRPATGRWTLGQNITKIVVAADDTIQVTSRSGIVTVSIGDAALPPLTVK